MTSSNTVGRLLLAYEAAPEIWQDEFNYLGQPGGNGIPDILDEAKWGLDWILKMHPEPDQLFHQVADDRDHIGFKYPHQDSSDYGWGAANSYRTAYYASGKPQGLDKWQNSSTGIANLAGRCAAVLARGHRIWVNELQDAGRGLLFLKAARELYAMGVAQPGCQEGTPMRASYRYHESSWTDDMEWGAAELYLSTAGEKYLEDARHFSALAADNESWMGADTADHYEWYPFMNAGHRVLSSSGVSGLEKELAEYYRGQLAAISVRRDQTPYGVGHPFIWCSNNLASALIVQNGYLKEMTGNDEFRDLGRRTMDWIYGCNPWGVSQVIGIGQVTSMDYHSSYFQVSGRHTPGGLLDGPLYKGTIAKHSEYIQLSEAEDEYSEFQSDYVVYHDDVKDYATNEPTLDGTAELLLAWTLYYYGR